MVRKTHRGGIGAIGLANASFFHPSEQIRAKFPNTWKKERLTNCTIIRDGIQRVNRRDQRCYFVNVDGFDCVLHIVAKKFRVDVAPENIFDDERCEDEDAPAPVDADASQIRRMQHNVVPNVMARATASSLREEIDELRRRGIEVDDDNEPVVENAWAQPSTSSTGQWIIPTICCRRAESKISNAEGKWKKFSWKEVGEMGEFDLFRMTFPEEFVVEVIIPSTNKHLDKPLSLQEWYVWLGCQFFMACFEGIENREDWWSMKPITPRHGAPFRLNDHMQKSRFLDICAATTFTDKQPPAFKDPFYDVRQMLEAFNKHYEDHYIPSWLNCLDESMSSWLNQYCPGFMFVPRKPHPSGNEYHSIADGDQGKPVMWRIKLQEGKDRPVDDNNKPRFPTKFESHTKTSALMLYMTEPIHNTGKIVTMDSGFCVAAGILALHDFGVFGQSLIKKRGQYWPKHVPGQEIDDHMKDKPLGHAETYKQFIDGKEFMIHCQKDDTYVTKIMSTHGLVTAVEDHTTYRFIDGEWKTFHYAKPMSHHSRSKHWVDDVNNRRHDRIGLEYVWATKWWPMRQFTFICSVAEVNAVNSRARARNNTADPQLTFRRNLAWDMLENKIEIIPQQRGSPMKTRNRRKPIVHDLKKRPIYTGRWDPVKGKFKKIVTDYMRLKCGICNNRTTRMYCSCNPGIPMCKVCYGRHQDD